MVSLPYHPGRISNLVIYNLKFKPSRQATRLDPDLPFNLKLQITKFEITQLPDYSISQ